jgi:hypothetical protein
MRTIGQRLAKLERDATAEVLLYAWASPGETADQAIARQFPEGIAETATVNVFRFAEPPDAGGWAVPWIAD